MTLKTTKTRAVATVTVGEKGQIVIPKDMRDMFGIAPGDTLLLLADIDRGIAVMHGDETHAMLSGILAAEGREVDR